MANPEKQKLLSTVVDVPRRTNYIPSNSIELWFYLLQIQFVLLHTEKKNKCTCRHTMFVEPSHSPSIHSINFSQNAQQTLFKDRLFAPPLCLSVQSSAVLRSRIKAHHFWGFMFYVPIVQNTMQTGVCRCSGLSKIKHYLLLSKWWVIYGWCCCLATYRNGTHKYTLLSELYVKPTVSCAHECR